MCMYIYVCVCVNILCKYTYNIYIVILGNVSWIFEEKINLGSIGYRQEEKAMTEDEMI